MKTKKAGIRRARRLYRRREYAQLINYLEPQVFMFRDNEEFYFLLGDSCLRTGDVAGAHSYLMRSRDIDDENPNTLLALGATYVRRRQIDRALETYLSILDIEPRHRRAKRALAMLRTVAAPDDLDARFAPRRLNRVLPARRPYIPRGVVTIAAVVVAAAFLYGVATIVVPRVISRPQRPGSDIVQVDRDDIETRTTGEFSLVLSDREIQQLFRTIRANFSSGRDNLVRRDINRILLSNAALPLQDRAALLIDFLQVPDFTSFSDNFSYEEVATAPGVHDGVYVRWRGRTANRVVGDEAIRFDLLAGFETGQLLLGTVPMAVPFPVLIENDVPVEVIGRVMPDDGSFSLEITNIRVLTPAELEDS